MKKNAKSDMQGWGDPPTLRKGVSKDPIFINDFNGLATDLLVIPMAAVLLTLAPAVDRQPSDASQ
jgi:hypothetical protein